VKVIEIHYKQNAKIILKQYAEFQSGIPGNNSFCLNAMEKTVAVDSQPEILKGVSEMSLSSSSVVALPHEVILQSPVENKNVDVSNMSNAELMKFLQDKELSKMREKYLKQNQKGKDTDKEHKFWNTQPMPGL
jgi:hypothetical protein